MSELRQGIGFGGIALIPITCCVGLPLLVASGVSVAAFALIGGITVVAIALAAAIGLLVVRASRHRTCAPPTITQIRRRS